jgi:NADPH:quinone reductase-like Zn-dependent oxidoreductase
VHATSLNAADWHVVRGSPVFLRFQTGFPQPKSAIPGSDVAGIVEAVGKTVTLFRPGDAVYGDLSGSGWGGLAEYVCAPENLLALKPSRMTFEETAAIPMAACTALQSLRKGQIQAGKKVLINGASGGVGTFAVQLAKAFGAEVTAVCSTGKIDMVRSLGADHVIDYTREDFTQTGQHYDLILAANGHHSIFAYKRALKPGGIYMVSGGSLTQIFQAMLLGPIVAMGSGKTLGNVMAAPSANDLVVINGLIEAGKVHPIIDRCYPLNESAEAIRYLEEGHARGKIVVTISPSDK